MFGGVSERGWKVELGLRVGVEARVDVCVQEVGEDELLEVTALNRLGTMIINLDEVVPFLRALLPGFL